MIMFRMVSAAGLLIATAPAQAGNTAVEVPIKTFVAAFSKGDNAAAAKATHVTTGAVIETARMTFAMVKAGAAWKIAAWTWIGPDPVAVK